MDSGLKHGEYLIDGEPASGDDYVSILEHVFNSKDMEAFHFDRCDGATLSFMSPSPYSILWHKADGSWAPLEAVEKDLNLACEIAEAFLQGDDETLAGFAWGDFSMTDAEAKRLSRGLLLVTVVAIALYCLVNYLLF